MTKDIRSQAQDASPDSLRTWSTPKLETLEMQKTAGAGTPPNQASLPGDPTFFS